MLMVFASAHKPAVCKLGWRVLGGSPGTAGAGARAELEMPAGKPTWAQPAVGWSSLWCTRCSPQASSQIQRILGLEESRYTDICVLKPSISRHSRIFIHRFVTSFSSSSLLKASCQLPRLGTTVLIFSALPPHLLHRRHKPEGGQGQLWASPGETPSHGT